MFKQGDHLRLTQDLSIARLGDFPKGTKGTVVKIDQDDIDGVCMFVRLDHPVKPDNPYDGLLFVFEDELHFCEAVT